MKTGITAVFALALAANAAQAQDVIRWPAPATYTDNARTYYLPIGTPLVLRTRTEVNSKQAKPGDRVYLDVAESVTFRGQIVVPAGAVAVGQVVRSERNGHFGKRGEVEIRLLYAETPNGPVRLTGAHADNGRSATAWSVGAIALTGGVVWGLIHGTSGYIRPGAVIQASLAEPLRFVHQPDQTKLATAQADAKPLPARFDPTVFGGNGPGSAAQ